MNVALLTAAGSGTRMNQDIPKQFIHVEDKPIIIHTMEAFQKHPSVDAIIVVTIDAWCEVLWAYAKQFNITKLKWVTTGGDTSQKSIYNGLIELRKHLNSNDVVMVHDGNRPLVTSEVISDSMATFSQYGSAVAVIPCTEVVFESDDGKSSCTSTEREKLFRTQTPHTYTFGDLMSAHEQAKEKGIVNTAASCMLMKELGKTTYFSKGSEENLKITTLEDLRIFKALLHTQQDKWLKE
ncbi:2-C-methyl-D-erythritol 4-phosphate cytidylyltransferase [Muricomes intestini]|uniref:2-C-methyl-D-erythritol 4-phosphate cytidylyltransferase n=1 Tax=Muricomes intestini TaxID=1796634 RepID=A0A4R3K2I2_9FIRM|nr:IspD/TarI family cytidylyltransferase [Muricomes intestini]TCS76631.1 2-C-methyl-D-erythritol 4-phosphate cytidylyltransferase [Muricomes intestini]